MGSLDLASWPKLIWHQLKIHKEYGKISQNGHTKYNGSARRRLPVTWEKSQGLKKTLTRADIKIDILCANGVLFRIAPSDSSALLITSNQRKAVVMHVVGIRLWVSGFFQRLGRPERYPRRGTQKCFACMLMYWLTKFNYNIRRSIAPYLKYIISCLGLWERRELAQDSVAFTAEVGYRQSQRQTPCKWCEGVVVPAHDLFVDRSFEPL